MFRRVSVCVVEGDLNCIAGATSRNGAFIWDVKKGKMITRFNEVGFTAIGSTLERVHLRHVFHWYIVTVFFLV